MTKQHITEIIQKQKLTTDIYKFTVDAPDIAQNAMPGQFLQIKCSEGMDTILRRPISISNVNKADGEVDFIIQSKGKATRALSEKKIGEKLDIIGPLGKGFTLSEKNKRVAVIGGGIGIFPLLFLINQLNDIEVNTFLGFRNKNYVILEKSFKEKSSKLTISTDDGSYGYNGVITDLFLDNLKNKNYDMIFACGPLPMLKKIKEIAITNNIKCEISVEERMGCGVGACLGCAIKLKNGDDWNFGHVCKDGPVFKVQNVIWD